MKLCDIVWTLNRCLLFMVTHAHMVLQAKKVNKLSYLLLFVSYKAQNWYTDHIQGVEANYMKAGTIISHYDVIMASYISNEWVRDIGI